MSHQVDYSITNMSLWLRFLYMLGFSLVLQLIFSLFWLLVVAQLVCVVLVGSQNTSLSTVCKRLTHYIKEIIDFLLFTTERKPYPFADFPDSAHDGSVPESSH